jgi:hypothetical protein
MEKGRIEINFVLPLSLGNPQPGIHRYLKKWGRRRDPYNSIDITAVSPMEWDAVYLEMKNKNWVTKNVYRNNK